MGEKKQIEVEKDTFNIIERIRNKLDQQGLPSCSTDTIVFIALVNEDARVAKELEKEREIMEREQTKGGVD